MYLGMWGFCFFVLWSLLFGLLFSCIIKCQHNYTRDSCLEPSAAHFSDAAGLKCKSQYSVPLRTCQIEHVLRAHTGSCLLFSCGCVLNLNSPVCFARHVPAPLDSWGAPAAHWSVKKKQWRCFLKPVIVLMHTHKQKNKKTKTPTSFS